MGERNFYLRYHASRSYADKQAEKLTRGEVVRGWAYETDWRPGTPEPPKVSLNGAAWVAHAYEIAADSATSLIHTEGVTWRPVYEECKGLAMHYEKAAKEQGRP